MLDAEIHRLAQTAQALMHLLVPDPAEIDRLRRRLTDALALSPGPAATAVLLEVLFSNPSLSGWIAEQTVKQYRNPERYLATQVPRRVPPGHDFSVLVRVTVTPRDISSLLHSLPRQGTPITITVSAPGFRALGNLRQNLLLPSSGDSPMVEFGLHGEEPGLHMIVVRAFADGTYLGEVSSKIQVQDGSMIPGETVCASGMPRVVDPTPGEVTLEVFRTVSNRYAVRILGASVEELAHTDTIMGDARGHVARMLEELSRNAAGSFEHAAVAARGTRLENLGISLWQQAVPPAVREQYWEMRPRMKSLRVLCDTDNLPWELMHPMDGSRKERFLVEDVAMFRQVGGPGPARHIPLRSVAFVMSEYRPRNTEVEIAGIKEVLGPNIVDRGRIGTMAEFVATLDAPPSILHLPGHSQFVDEEGSIIGLDDGPLRPYDLAAAVQRKTLTRATPIVFLNSCQSAGEAPGLTRPMGWARQFMAAGAGAFIGTLWPVNSDTAREFATAFYRALSEDKATLGTAMAAARAVCAGDRTDPTWLAYTIYGDANAIASPEESS